MMSRPVIVTVMIAAVALIALTIGPKPVPLLVWNGSASAPLGLYSVQPADELIINDLVVAMPPEPLATFLAEGGYLPRGVPPIKRVLALSGQSLCRHGLHISVDGIDMGLAREHDRHGRSLPTWKGCRVIGDGELFLMNWDEPASLDGRYFGSIPSSSILGRAVRLWTVEKQ